MTLLAPRIGNHLSYVTRINDEIHFPLTLLALRIGNDVSYVMWINDEIHFAWQAQYLVKLGNDSCCFPHCKSVSYVRRINDEIHPVASRITE